MNGEEGQPHAPIDELIQQGAHVMTVCNACRYCEQSCPVFPAMEERLTFAKVDLAYLANLCHNCGECLYACQYAPPHEFGINVPKTLAEIRLQSYQEYAWPRALGVAFTRHNLLTGLGLAAVLSAIMAVAAPGGLVASRWVRRLLRRRPARCHGEPVRDRLSFRGDRDGDWSHAIRARRSGADAGRLKAAPTLRGAGLSRPITDALTLRHLHASGADCVSGEEQRSPWRRWLHHCTFYGFLLCFASTSVAALYDNVFGWRAPYAYTSLPVVLGTVGGVGLLVGSLGLWILRRRRDPAMGDEAQHGLDESFLALLFFTTLTGLALLVLRHEPVMPWLLIVHLGTVLALFLTLPYGKFVHGLYRVAALAVDARDRAR